ncbi:hypothetical protein CYY_000483 [Polysphondylium violaceum]|uniref:AAA+ ATPase domain-containing protein n=1 Tax=Polysphondylium violaceum TaxID=133409 RepID=A0A8J4V5I9_9MYCE|nr:hypothetical protein CYY_000483 [Polysphondylium violaceum]
MSDPLSSNPSIITSQVGGFKSNSAGTPSVTPLSSSYTLPSQSSISAQNSPLGGTLQNNNYGGSTGNLVGLGQQSQLMTSSVSTSNLTSLVTQTAIPQSTSRGISTSCFEFFYIEMIEYIMKSTENDKIQAFKKLDKLGIKVGHKLVERLSLDTNLFPDLLDSIKFICKIFWMSIFKKTIDGLKTNHKGVFVLTDNKFQWLQHLSFDPTSSNKDCSEYVQFACGLIKGAMLNFGYKCSVTFEIQQIYSYAPFKVMTAIAESACSIKAPKRKKKKFEDIYVRYEKDKQRSPDFDAYFRDGFVNDKFMQKYNEFINSFGNNYKEWKKKEIYFLLLGFYHQNRLVPTDTLFRFLDGMGDEQVEIFAREYSNFKNQEDIFDLVTYHFRYNDYVIFQNNNVRTNLYFYLILLFKDKSKISSKIHSMTKNFNSDIDNNRLFFYILLIMMVTKERDIHHYESKGLFHILLKRDEKIYSALKRYSPAIRSYVYDFISTLLEDDFKFLIQKKEYFDIFQDSKSFQDILSRRYIKNGVEKYKLELELYDFLMNLDIDTKPVFHYNFRQYVKIDIIRSVYFSLYRQKIFDIKELENWKIHINIESINNIFNTIVELESEFKYQSNYNMSKETNPFFFKIVSSFIESNYKGIKVKIPTYFKHPTLIHYIFYKLKIDKIKKDPNLQLDDKYDLEVHEFKYDPNNHWQQQQIECSDSFEKLGQIYSQYYNKMLESSPLTQKERYNKLIKAMKKLKSIQHPIKSYEDLEKEFLEAKLKYERLYRVYQFILDYGFQEFSKETISYSVDPKLAYQRLKDHLTNTMCEKIPYLLESDTIEIIEVFIDSNLFEKIFNYYKNQEQPGKEDLNTICLKFRMFIDKIHSKTISKEHTELLFILKDTPSHDISFIYQHSKFTQFSLENVLRYFNQAVSLVSMAIHLTPFYKFIEGQSFIVISDFDEIRKNLENMHQLLSGDQLLDEDIEKTQEKLKQMLGGLSTIQIKLFSVINMDIIEFFSEFEDKQSFDDRTNLITTNLFSDGFSSSLIDSATIVFHCLSSIVKVYKTYKSTEPRVKSVYSLNQFCQTLLSTFPSVDNLENTFVRLASIQSNMSSLRSLYAFEHGTSTFQKICDILNSSEFYSRYGGEDGWFIKLNQIDYKSEKLKDWEYGLKLRNISDEQKETLARYQSLLAQLEEIHQIHTELDQLFTPEYFGICIKVPINNYCHENIKKEKDEYQQIIKEWRDKMQSFGKRIRLLRTQSISSLYLSIKQLLSMKDSYINGDKEMDLKKSIAKTFVSFVKFCFSKSLIPVSQELIESSIKDIDLGLAVYEYINRSFKEFENIFKEEKSGFIETGPTLVYIKSKEQIYLTMVELNGSKFPHSNQIFFGHKINQEIDDLFYLLVNFSDRPFFLINFPENCQKLLQRLSTYYNDHEFDLLSKFYIISIAQNSAFEFIEKSEHQCEYKWPDLKDLWKANNPTKQLYLISGPSGSGKSFYVNKKIPNRLTLLAHPNTFYSQLIQGVMSKLHCPKNTEKELCLHIIVTPYEDKYFNSFIYHLIMFGIIMNEKNGQLIDIGHLFSKLVIYVEIGQPMDDFIPPSLKLQNNLALECQFYAQEFIPLIFNLSDNLVYKLDWEINEKMDKCLLYYYDSAFHKKVPTIKFSGLSEPLYMDHIVKTVGGQCSLAYLSDPSCLQYKNNFFSLLSERLDFLSLYISIYDQMTRSGYTDQSLPEDLYKLFVLEAVNLADPKLCSVETIWDRPPAITTRTIIKYELNRKPIDLPYLDPIDLNEKNFQKFLSTVSQAFGIESHTYMIENLSHLYNYILTPEFTLRIVILHEKIKNQKSLILTGDTGTGKTHILRFYSLLINAKNNALKEIIFELQEFTNKMIAQSTGKESKLNIIDIQRMAEENSLLTINATDDGSVIVGSFISSNETSRLHFRKIEDFIQKILNSHKLIELIENSLLWKIKKSKTTPVITNNEILNEALKELVNVKFISLFYRIIMHQKYNSNLFKIEVMKFQNKASELKQIDPSLKLVVFIDEFNTSPNDTMALINELFTDGTLDGSPLMVDNIFWIGAMNPKSICKNTLAPIGSESSTMKQAFLVNDPPPSMNQLYFNFGEFNSQSEEKFIEGLLKNYKEPFSLHLKESIIIGQNRLRISKQDRVHVSMRDIIRAIDLYTFFIKDKCGQSLITCGSSITINEHQKHWTALILSMALTYYIRFTPGLDRDRMAMEFQTFLDRKVDTFEARFLQVFKDRYLSLCKLTNLPSGVALTESLMLNIFCTVVSINCGIPLCIVGPPGCSKTLSFTIVIDNMKKPCAENSPYSLMPEVKPFRHACTPHTTDIEIKSKFEQAINRQKAIQSNLSTCVLFLDEASLIDEDKSPLKVMHEYLDKFTKRDDPQDNIGIIILSNKTLDAAKTNRALLLVHPDNINHDDIRSLVMGCLLNKTDKKSLDKKEKKMVSALCGGYEKVHKYAPKGFFHQRDFVFFLKQLNTEYIKKGIELPLALLNCLERNFGGIPHPDFIKLAKVFYEALDLSPPASFATNNTIDALKRSLAQDLNEVQKPSEITFRYGMLVDPSNETSSSLQILKEVGIEHTVVRVGGFGNDKSEESLVQVLSLIKSKMATETTLVLVNTEVIDPCFYELFNRYFILMPSREANGRTMFLSNVSFGSHSIHFEVHPKFKVLIHMPLSRIPHVQTPWINRFEKFYLSIDVLTQFKNTGFEESSIKRFDFLSKSSQNFVDQTHVRQSQELLLIGYSKTETIPSLVYSYSKKLQDSESENYARTEKNISEQTAMNFKLLQIARPEAIIKYSSFLPPEYKHEYFNNQEHFSIIRFLRNISANKSRESNKWTIFTRNSPSLVSLKDIDVSLIRDDSKDNASQVKVLHLTIIQSSAQCQQILQSFKQSSIDNLLIIVVDSSIIDRNVVNFVFECLSDLDKSKLFVMIYAFPTELSILKQLQNNCIFLNDNDYMYIDSLGLDDEQNNQKEFETKETVFRSLINAACKIESIPQKEDLFNVFQKIFLTNLSKISSSMTPFNHRMHSVSGKVAQIYTKSSKRTRVLNSLFKNNPIWMESVIESFISQLVFSFNFIKLLENISDGILYGKDPQSLTKSFECSLVSYISPVISNIVKILFSHLSFGRILEISKNYLNLDQDKNKSLEFDDDQDSSLSSSDLTIENIKEQYQLISLIIRSSDVPNLPTISSIKKLEPITLPIHKTDTNYQLPLYYYIETSLLNIISRVLIESGSNDIKLNYCYLSFYLETHPIRPVLEYINSSAFLFNLFKQDFIKYRFNISAASDIHGSNGPSGTDPNLTNFFIGIMDIILPIKDEKRYSQIVQYFIIQKYYLDTIKFIYSSIVPIQTLMSEEERATFLNNQLLVELSRLTGGEILNIQELKVCLIQFSVQKMELFYNQKIKSRVLELGTITTPIKEATILWLRVAKDLFNRIKITDIIQFKNNRYKIYYIHTLYQILVNTDLDDPKSKELFDLSDTFMTNDPIQLCNQLKKCKISNETLLDIMQPIIQNDPKYFLNFIEQPTTPIGWSCNLFNLIYRDDPINLTMVINDRLSSYPKSYETVATPFNQCLDSISTMIQMIFKTLIILSKNGNLVDIVFYSFYEMIKENGGNRCAQFKSLYQAKKENQTPIDKIQLVATSCVILDQLANDINTLDLSQMISKVNGKEIQQIYKTILGRFENNDDDGQTIIYKMYLFKKITNEKTLLQFLQSMESLTSVGLSKHHITDNSIQLDDKFYMPFMYDKCPEYYCYTQCLELIDRRSLDPFKSFVNNFKTLNSWYKSIGSIRMILFLLAYRFYMNGNDQNLLFIKQIVEDPEICASLYLGEYLPHFLKVINKDFNWDNQIDVLLFDKLSTSKSKEMQDRAYCIVNFIAISIGSTRTHLSKLTTHPLDAVLKDFPGCEGGVLIDCNMRYRLLNKPIETDSMDGIVLNKFIINAMTWSVLAFSASVKKLNYTAFNSVSQKKFIHFPEDSKNASNYILSRGIVSFGELSMAESYLAKNIDPVMLLSNISFKLWDKSFTDATIKETFKDRESIAYEKTFCKIIAEVEEEYENKRQASYSIVSEKNPFLGSIFKIRYSCSLFATPFISYEAIYDLLSRENPHDHQLLRLFMSKIKNICSSSHFSTLINFLKLFFKYNSNVIPQSYLQKGMKDIFQYLLSTHTETEESIAVFKNEWEQFKQSWTQVRLSLSSIQGCPRANEYEKEIPIFDDDTPVILLLSNKEERGYIINVITDWLDHTQTQIINKSKESLSPTLSKLEGFYDSDEFDICDITPEFGTNYMLIGSNFNEEDFIDFIRFEISKYQHFGQDNQQLKPNWNDIEKRVILNYISGRNIQGPQFKEYIIDFPFNKKLDEYGNNNNNINNNCKQIVNSNNNRNSILFNNDVLSIKPVGPQYFKDLIATCDSLIQATGKRYKQKISPNDKLKFKSYFKFKLSGNGLEILGTFLVETMIKLLSAQDDDKDGEKCICVDPNIENLTKIDKNISTLLSKTPINKIISVSKILINCNSGYKSFSSIIPEPVKIIKEIVDAFKQISKKIQDSCGNITQKIKEWIDYLLDFINANLEIKTSISQVQPNQLLVKLFKDFKLTNIPQGSTILFNIFSEIPTNTNSSYYSLFMDMLQDTLMKLYIKLDEEQTFVNVYKELQAPKKDIESLNLEIDNIPTYQKSNPLGEAKILTMEENTKNVNLKIVGRPSDPYRTITTNDINVTTGERVMISNLFNWLRFTLLNSNLHSKIPKDSFTFFTCIKTFITEANSKTNYNALDVSELYKQMNIPNQVLSSPSQTLTTMLQRVASFFIDDHINSLVGLKITPSCNDCDEDGETVNCDFIISQIQIPCEISSQSLSKIVTSHSNTLKAPHKKECSTCEQELRIKTKYPQYIFFDVNRSVQGEFNHDKLEHPNSFQLLKSTYVIDSVLNIDDSINIYQDKNMVSFKPNSITMINDKQESERSDHHHSRLLIYKLSTAPTTTTNLRQENRVDENAINNNGGTFISSPSLLSENNNNNDQIWEGKSASDIKSTLNNHFILWINNLNYSNENKTLLVKLLETSQIVDFDTAFILSLTDWQDVFKENIALRAKFLKHFEELKNQYVPQQGITLSSEEFVLL